MFVDVVDSHVTHIVASQLPHIKTQKVLNAMKPKNIVKPDWVVACVEAGRLNSKVATPNPVDTTFSGRKLPEHDYLLIERSSALAVTHGVCNLGQVQVSDVVTAGTALTNFTHESANEDLSIQHPDSQQAHVEFDNEEDAGEDMLSSALDQDGSLFEDVTDVPYCNNAAPVAAAATEITSDPGINGKSTEAWVAQFFAQSRLHYIGSWQQRCYIPTHCNRLSTDSNVI